MSRTAKFVLMATAALFLIAGKPVKRVRALVTHYDSGKCCCGPKAKGLTSTGTDARKLGGCAVAPKLIRYRSIVRVAGRSYIADDTGSAMRRDARRGVYHIDLRVATHSEARRLGSSWQWITIERAK